MAIHFQNMKNALEKAQTIARNASTFRGKDLADQLDEIASRLDRPPLIAVIGEFSAGKSTLINRLLDINILPTDVLPTTARPARLQYGDRPGLILNRRSGFRELRSVDDFKHYGHKNDTRVDSLGLAEVTNLEVFIPNPVLHSYQILDTPGVSDPNQDVEITLAAIREADALIWCTIATQAWKSSEAEFWDQMPEDVKKTAILVVTHCDALNSDEDRDKVQHRVKNQTQNAFSRVIMASLRVGRNGRDDSSVSQIQSAIQEMVLKRAQEMRIAWAKRSAVAAIKTERYGHIRRFDDQTAAFDKLKRICDKMKAEWSKTRLAIFEQLMHVSKEFDSLFDVAGRMAHSIVTRMEFHEPEEICEEGIFTDDYKVVWHERWMQDFDWDRIREKHDLLTEQVGKIVESASAEIGKYANAFIDKFSCQLDPHLKSLKMDTSDSVSLLRQDVLLIDSVLMSAYHRIYGSIECGGFFIASTLHTLVEEHQKKLPTGSELRELLGACFSFEEAATIVEDGESHLDEMTKDVVKKLEYWGSLGEKAKQEIASLHKEFDSINSVVILSGN